MAKKDVFSRLARLFATNVVVRRVGKAKAKIVDLDQLQSAGNINNTRMIDRFTKVHGGRANIGSYNMSHQFRQAKLQIYTDYESIDTDARCSAALNAFADEATLKNEEGEILSITSPDENIKNILHNLFYDILNIEFNLFHWTRTFLKYGDGFLLLDIHSEYGILNAQPLSAYEVTREEGFNPENPYEVRFIYEGAQGKHVFNNSEIIHFRLLEDSNYLPYGKSIFESSRRTWQALVLAEDAMLIHRILRAPTRRIFKIDIGNIPPAEVDSFMNQMIDKMKRVPYMDPNTGQYNLKYNMEPIDFQTLIPLLDGRTITIKELSEEYKLGKTNYVYSVDRKNNNKIVGGEVLWCDCTKKGVNVVRVWLDDDSYIDSDLGHPFMLRDGSYKSAKDLQENDRLMPFYTKQKNGKEMVLDPSDETYKYTSKLNNDSKEVSILTDEVTMEINHKVKRIEFLAEKSDVYCMNVKTYHNFAIDSHGGTARNGVFVKNSMLEDYYLPVRGDKSGTEITNLDGMQWTGIEDMKYMEKKLFAGLGVPKQFLNYHGDEGGDGSKSTISMMDIKFARRVEKIQRILISEFTKMAIIHLFVQGYTDADLTNFSLEMNSPSIIYEQEKITLLQNKVNLILSALQTGLYSEEWILKNIMKLGESDAEKMQEQVLDNIKRKFRKTQIETEGNDPVKSGQSFGTPHDLASLYTGQRDKTGYILGEKDEKVDKDNETNYKRTETKSQEEDRLGNKEMESLYHNMNNDNKMVSPKGNRPSLSMENRASKASVKRIIEGLPKKLRKNSKTLLESIKTVNDKIEDDTDTLLDEKNLEDEI